MLCGLPSTHTEKHPGSPKGLGSLLFLFREQPGPEPSVLSERTIRALGPGFGVTPFECCVPGPVVGQRPSLTAAHSLAGEAKKQVGGYSK